ncbi:hypothetical protein BC940DRAFT_138706 [Gongronella butleri]|nr:hypothetical protein BC940DRAFT_138706 [Gongronella butleri]
MNRFLFYIVFLISCTLTLVQAQGINIMTPKPGERLTAGRLVTVQVVKNNHIIASTEVGIAIGIRACEGGQCPPPENQLGQILYTGPFDPQFHGPGPAYQNFTVTVPKSSTVGNANLNVVRFFLIGAGPTATIGYANVKVNIIR